MHNDNHSKLWEMRAKPFEKFSPFGGQPPKKLPDFIGCDAKFPEEVFDPSMRIFMHDFARAFRVDFGVAATLALSTAAMSCRGRFRVAREEDHQELLALYTILRLPPSCMKTSMIESVIAPFDIANYKTTNSANKLDITDQKILEKRIKIFENEAALCDNELKLNKLKCEIRKIRKELDDSTRQYRWRVGSGFTPEGLARIAYEEGGTLAIVGSELGKLKKFPANRDDVLLAGWEGAAFESNTKKNPFKIKSLCLNILLFVQNNTSRKLIDVADFVDDGLISRFLIITPCHTISNTNDTHIGILAEESKDIWQKTLQTIFEYNNNDDVVLHLDSSDATQYWKSLWDYCYKQSFCEEMKPGMSNWYRKAAGTTLRIAALLHLLDKEVSTNTTISLNDIKKAILVFQYYESQTLFMFQEDKEKTLKRAKRILDIFKATSNNSLCERDIYRKVGSGELDTDYQSALKLLNKYYWISIVGGKGNKNVCLNPQAREEWDKRSSV